MKTLEYLNSLPSTPVAFVDNRDPDVRFSSLDFRNLELVTNNTTFSAQYPVEIVEIIRPTLANVTYRIEMPPGLDVSLSWFTVPSGVTVLRNANVWTVVGIQTVSHWNSMKSPTISVPAEFEGYVYYNSSISYVRKEGLKTYSWQVGSFIPTANIRSNFIVNSNARRFRSTSINLLASLSNDQAILDEKVYLDSGNFQQFYAKNTTVRLNGPTIVSPHTVGVTYTISVTPSNTSVVSNISLSSNPGVTFSFNNTTKVANLSGNRDAMITALDNLRITFAANAVDDFMITYQATTNAPSLVNNATAIIQMLSTEFFGEFSSNLYYGDVLTGNVVNELQITNNSNDPTNDITFSYVCNIEPTNPSGFQLIDAPAYTAFNTPTQSFTANGEDLLALVSADRSRIYYRNFLSGPTQVNEYILANGQYVLNWTFTPQDAFSTDFGSSMAINRTGDTLIIGDDLFPEGSDSRGSVSIYRRTNNSWTLEQRITGTPNTSQRLGIDVTINEAGNIIAVSHTGIDGVRLYSRSGSSWTQFGAIAAPQNFLTWGQKIFLNAAGNKIAIQNSTNDTPRQVYVYTILNASPFVVNLDYTLTFTTLNQLRTIFNDGSIIVSDKLYNNVGTLIQTFPASVDFVNAFQNYLVAGLYMYKFENNSWNQFKVAPGTSVFYISQNGDELLLREEVNDIRADIYTEQPTGKIWDNNLKRLTLFGSKNRINAMLQNLSYRLIPPVTQDIAFNYELITPSGAIETRTQLFNLTVEEIDYNLTSSFTVNVGLRQFGSANLTSNFTLFENGAEVEFSGNLQFTSISSLACTDDNVYPYIQFHERARRFNNITANQSRFLLIEDADNSGLTPRQAPQVINAPAGRFFNARISIIGVVGDGIFLTTNGPGSASVVMWLNGSPTSNNGTAYTSAGYNNRMTSLEFLNGLGSASNRQIRIEVFRYNSLTPGANPGIKIGDYIIPLTYVNW